MNAILFSASRQSALTATQPRTLLETNKAMETKQKPAEKISLAAGDALLLIDIQNDFLPGGCLAVAEGDQVIPVLNGYIEQFTHSHLPVFASRDWHPEHHGSFIQQGGAWPEHCIAGSIGAEFAGDLKLPAATRLISKGIEPEQDGYSAFANSPLQVQLKQLKVSRLFIGGLATDYCVLNTVREALNLGYRVLLLTDAVRAVNVHPRAGDAAIREMLHQGAIPITLMMIR